MIRPSMLLAALLAFAPMAMADDGARSRGQANQAPQQGGINRVIEEVLPAPEVAPVTPIESLPVESAPPTEVPIVEAETPIALPAPIQKQQSMDRANTLPALGLGDQLPPEQVNLGQVEPLGTGNQTGELGSETPIVDLPAQGGVEQQTQTRAEPAKKPGFFKRMWTKVKGFFAGIKNKLTRNKKAPSASQNGEVTIQDEPSLAPGGSDGPGSAPVG